ncbi:MAG TPA: hypothetical protein PLI95_21270, partial [Polyangiaceae bacterium]|nr:hypothetical protein [Polyangiaceae bacterium]
GGTGQGGTGQGGMGQGGTGQGGSSGNCPFTDSIDHDGDGWAFTSGDCNDCDTAVNPGAFDGAGPIGKPGVDDDCDGSVDNAAVACDDAIALDDPDPMRAARAIGLCAQTTDAGVGKDKRWGVISAEYVRADGSLGMAAASHGIMPAFGPAKAQQGANLLVLSTGSARTPGQPGYVDAETANMGTTGGAPLGFPKPSSLCPGVSPSTSVHDPAALQVKVRVPTNAHGFGFRFNVYSYEFPMWVCSAYADVFVALVSPAPPGSQNGNVSFDSAGNTLGANSQLLLACNPLTTDAGASFPCPLGPSLLTGTGYDQTTQGGPHAATGWLESLSSAPPGEVITIRFAVWDAGDAIMNMSALIDRFEWRPSVSTVSTQPVVNPI